MHNSNPSCAGCHLITDPIGLALENFDGAGGFRETEDGLEITYDPHLRDAVAAAMEGPTPDLWPLFDAMDGLPLACIRGATSDLLTPETLAEMQRRRPDMITAVVPGRGHVPFLNEPEAVAALHKWVEAMA